MTLIGHQAPQQAVLNAWRNGRMHHAWLLAGPKGIGKAMFADLAAGFVLSGGEGERLEDAKAGTAALLAAGSHQDFRRLQRTLNDRGDRLRAEIVVDQVRDMQGLLNGTPTIAEWRAVVVDATDDLNRSAANALLKNLEEPPKKTVFFLVSHSPSRLLPTIRSRCRQLRFRPLGDAETRDVLERHLSKANRRELDALVALANGSPGMAIRFAGLEIERLHAELVALSAAAGAAADKKALQLAKSLAGKAAQPRYEAFVELVPGFIAAEARGLSGASLARAIALWEKAAALAAEAMPLAHDPQAVAFELSGLVSQLGQNRQAGRR